MDNTLIATFDSFTMEDVELFLSEKMSFELSEKTLERIQEKVNIKIITTNKTMKKLSLSGKSHKMIKIFLIAAVIVTVLAAGAFAAHLSGNRFFSQLFGSKNYNIIEDYVLSDIAEISDEHLKFTLESALSDGHYYYVIFSVERLDEKSISGFLPDVDFQFTLVEPSRLKPAWQYEKLDTSENSDYLAYYLATIRSEVQITALNMDLKGLYSSQDGHRELPTALSLESGFLFCPLARGGDTEDTFRNIELSPFGLWIDVFEAWEDNDALSTGLPIHDISLKYRSGETVGASVEQFSDTYYLQRIGWNGMQRPNGTHQSILTVNFYPFIEIGNVEAVIIDGIEYSVQLYFPS